LSTLDTALAALENLRMSNRTIGIIPHVDALKQRISAQFSVEKGSMATELYKSSTASKNNAPIRKTTT
jgi:DNA repair exonuclease SbcCD ATPase subunit